MRTFKKIIVILLLNILTIGLLRFAFYQPTEFKQILNEFEKDQYNSIVMGQSLSQVGINPYLLSDEDQAVFNMARSGEWYDMMENLLRMLNSDGNIKNVYLDLDPASWAMDVSSSNSVEDMSEYLRLSARKHTPLTPSLAWHILKTVPLDDILFDYNFTLGVPYKKLQSILSGNYQEYLDSTNIISRGQSVAVYEYGGRGFLYGVHHRDMGQVKLSFEEENIPPANVENLKKIAQYCQENGIQLVCFTTAVQPERILNGSYDHAHEYFVSLCKEIGIPYYDFNYLKMEYLPRTDDDYIDRGGHMTGELADRQSRCFKNILASEDPGQFFHTDYTIVEEEARSMGKSASASGDQA